MSDPVTGGVEPTRRGESWGDAVAEMEGEEAYTEDSFDMSGEESKGGGLVFAQRLARVCGDIRHKLRKLKNRLRNAWVRHGQLY